MRVMSFNIRYDSPRDGENRWEQRRDDVAEIIRDEEPDLAGLQEPLENQLQDLAERLPDYAWYGAGREDGAHQGEFAPIFYRRERFERLLASTFWLSETPDRPGSRSWDASQPRIASWVKLRDRESQRTLFVFNTHFDNRGERARSESTALILEGIRQVAGDAPVVLTGDFNCPPSSEPYRILTGQQPAGGDGQIALRDTRRISAAPPEGPDSTWNGFQEVAPGHEIDFIFVAGSFQVARHRILNVRRDGRFASDHQPVVAELELATADA